MLGVNPTVYGLTDVAKVVGCGRGFLLHSHKRAAGGVGSRRWERLLLSHTGSPNDEGSSRHVVDEGDGDVGVVAYDDEPESGVERLVGEQDDGHDQQAHCQR